MTPADLARILAQPDIREVNEHLLPTTLAPGPLFGPIEAKRHSGALEPRSALPGRSGGVWRNEWEFQAAVIAESRLRAITQTEYAMLVAIPNGQYRNGQRPEAGLTCGLPDLALFVPRGGFGALFLELKLTPNKCSQAQRTMHDRLRMEGYQVEVVWDSVDAVMGIIEEYLNS